MTEISVQELLDLGLEEQEAALLSERYATLGKLAPDLAWQRLTEEGLRPSHPFAVHERLYALLSERWTSRGPLPAWIPRDGAETNVKKLLRQRGLSDVPALHAWSIAERGAFWEVMAERVGYVFAEQAERALGGTPGQPSWFEGARLNATQSCFSGPGDAQAILYQRPDGELCCWTYDELRAMTGRVANGLVAAGFEPGDALAIDMPMTPESVAIYLGIVRAGCAVVSIADSFSPTEVATRLRIGAAKAVFTQDVILRDGRTLALFSKIVAAEAPRAIVLSAGDSLAVELREGDLTWEAFLGEREPFGDHLGVVGDTSNVLFSSGTTGEPKAIPWTHITPLKCAVDGHLHMDIRRGDVVAWPTNLGWMMGPWLIYASLINGACMALYCGAPTRRDFGVFVQDARVSMLGVVPSLVATWRETDALHSLDWSAIKCFASTGECSNERDMLWLMSRANYKPLIEYCGGTEIGGGYVAGSLDQPVAPACFSTPTFGLDFVLLDEEGQEGERGEVFLVPPSVGLSERLLNLDHHEVYCAGTPEHSRGPLRRHGDWIESVEGGFYRAQGRVDDTMNLVGIKVSAAEIEALLNTIAGVHQTAAIAAPGEGGGPSRLVVYAELAPDVVLDTDELLVACRRRISERLNPLFKVSEVVVLDALPRTASNKIVRRKLRARTLKGRD